jgi:hypothetical protein
MRWLKRATDVARALDDGHLLGIIEVLSGQLALVRGQFGVAFERSVSGQRMLYPYSDVTFERNVGRMGALRAAEELGEYDYLRTRAFKYLNEAREAGDRYAEVTFSFSAAPAALAADDPAGAVQIATLAASGAAVGAVHIQHLYTSRALTLAALYAGNFREADRLLEKLWPGLERSQLLRVPVALIDALSLRARVDLALADAGERTRLERVEKSAARLGRVKRMDARGWAALLAGGVAAARANTMQAERLFGGARDAFAAAGMKGMCACAELRLGQLTGQSAAARAASHALDGLGVSRPDRWLLAYAPGGIERNAR